jgi:glycosyltransferase involved in cell wall biosynthesis
MLEKMMSNSRQKKVSVIIPCYNVEHYIDRCVNSLVNQTIGIENLELIFVDDASTDGTLEKLKQWEEKYPEQIMLIPCSKNRKQGAARNVGMQYVTGKYIGFVDADDYVSLEMYERLYVIAEEQQCDVVNCLFVRVDEEGKALLEVTEAERADERIEITSVEQRKELIRTGLPGGVVSKIYRRDFLEARQMYFPEEITYEDNYWGAFLLLEINSYYIINEPFYYYVLNEKSTVMQQDSFHHLDRLVIELMKVEEYRRRGVFECYHDEIEIQFLVLYFINTVQILFTRFHEIPYEIIYTMQDYVKELFPHYQKNPYLEELPQVQKKLLKMVEIPLNRERIDILANAFRKALEK